MMEYAIIVGALLLAFNNGANDNFKGFATVWGSNTLSYRQALTLATVATALGGLVSLLLAEGLVAQFSGKGLVPNEVVQAPAFILSVSVGAALTVMVATRLGLPVSTTHALIGGLVGAGMAHSAENLHFEVLANNFLLPLIVSPIVAALLGLGVFRVIRLRAKAKDCVCVEVPSLERMGNAGGVATMTAMTALPSVRVAEGATCDQREPPVARFSISRSIDRVHTFSAASICFARGVNDTPKLTALLLAAHVLGTQFSVFMVVAAMVVGGLLFSRRVAETMSRKMTCLDEDSGLAANLITATLVLFASKFGLPVSTTHVSVGSIAGVGAGSQTMDWRTVRNIAVSWVATLPLAAAVAWLVGHAVS